MILADLVAGNSVFLDSNTFIYHFGPHPVFGPSCSQLIQRIENQELQGFTSTHVLGEVAHRLMIVEASRQPGWAAGKVKRRLKKQRGVLQTLALFRAATESVLQSRLQVLTIPPALLASAIILSQQHDLLINDSIIVAVMQLNTLTKLASHDDDFDRVPGITRYAPA